MSLILKLLLTASIFLLTSCSNKETKTLQIKEVGLDQQMIEAYKKGMEIKDDVEGGHYINAIGDIKDEVENVKKNIAKLFYLDHAS